jgi:Ca2+/Na+ antiporter
MISVMHGDTAVGFGLVVGSALIAFGIIPPLCYFGQRRNANGDDPPPLALKSWPIVRDTGAFVLALTMVSCYMLLNHSEITIYESSSLLLFYALYIILVVCTAASAYSRDSKIDPSSTTPEVGESALLLSTGNNDATGSESEDSSGCGQCIVAMYKPLETIFTFIFTWTIVTPPKEKMPQTATGWFGTLMAFAWLALISEGIYELVLVVCDLTTFLNPATLGAVALSVGAQLPDALGAMAMTRAGIVEGAISATLSSQVLSITIALGLPWTIYIAMGHDVQLSEHTGTKIADSALLFILVVVILVFFLSVMLDRRGTHDGPQLGKGGSIAIMTAFGVAYLSFFVVEVMSEDGVFNNL